MQTKTFFGLFCIFAALLIAVNDSAPTPKPSVAKVVSVSPPKPVPGSRTVWSKKMDPERKKIFNDYKKIISKKLHAIHKVPLTFKPRPDKSASQLVSGVLYHYLVKLPSKQYAYITIHSQTWKKDKYGSEEHVTVRPQLYALNDKNI